MPASLVLYYLVYDLLVPLTYFEPFIYGPLSSVPCCYGSPLLSFEGLQSEYDNLSNILSDQKLGNPLFCWMIATVYNKCSPEEREILFNYSKRNFELGEIFLYQRFIHDIILGKPQDVVRRDFDKWQ